MSDSLNEQAQALLLTLSVAMQDALTWIVASPDQRTGEQHRTSDRTTTATLAALRRRGLISLSSRGARNQFWQMTDLGRLVNALCVVARSLTHRACVKLIADGAGSAIRQYGDRGRNAIDDLRAAGVIDPRILTLTPDLGCAVAELIADGGVR